MKNLSLSSVLVLIATSATHPQEAVQWKVSDGGNGNWYQFNRVPGGICWSASRIAAEQGGGHLVTVTSAAENSFVIAYTNANNPGVFTGGPYLGATCENAPWGQWRWVTGEPFVFTGWGAGEPNSGENERYVHLWRWGSLWWNDTSECGADSYIVEWSADCNNDGVVDYGQCRDGTLPDYNGNNVPDCCESGTPCVVGNYPVQWRVAEGGNGHWYQLISEVASWAGSRGSAQARGADLCSITTSAENNRVLVLVSRASVWCNDGAGYWLGGFRQEGQWRWTTGESFSFSYWGCGNPGDVQTHIQWYRIPAGCPPLGTIVWDDQFPEGCPALQGNPGFVAEWSADCNGDGIVDYGQILQGQLVDADANGVPDVCEVDPCPGDITNGGTVDAADLSILLAAWGTNGQAEFDTDIDGSGLVDGGDLALVLGGWGPCPQ